MNKLTPGEEFLREQVASFEYPYDDTAWLKMENALRRKGINNFLKWASGFAIFTAAVVTAVVYFSNTSSNKTSDNTNLIAIDNNVTNSTDQLNNESAIQNNELATENKNNNQVSLNNNTVNNSEVNNGINSAVTLNDVNNTCNQNITSVITTNRKSPCPDFTVSDNAGCPPHTVQFIPVEKCDSMIYSWDFGDGKISTEKQPAHTYAKPGNYNVKLMVKYFKTEEIKTRSIESVVTVYQKPKTKFDVIKNRNTVYLQTKMTANNLKWIANDTVSNESTAERTIMKNGTHSIILIAQNNEGCSDTLIKKIEINEPLNVEMANAFTPDNDGLNDIFGPISANPDISSYQLEIASVKGQTVYFKKAKEVGWNGINQQNNQPCEPGLYYFKLKIWDKYGNFEQRNGNVTLK